MQIPNWKKLLSYLFPITLEEASSAIHPSLQVALNKGRLQLTTANAVYSYEDFYTPFTFSFDEIKNDLLNYNSCLILGYGLGSVAVILKNKFQLDHIKITGVEYDEQIFKWAKKYQPENYAAEIKLVNEDAASFVSHCQTTFDIIGVDLFYDQSVAEKFQTTAFLIQCKTLLNENGVIIFNIIPSKTLANHSIFETNFKTIFPKNKCIPIAANEVWMGWQEKN